MKILFLGYIVGVSGCGSVKKNLSKIISEKKIDKYDLIIEAKYNFDPIRSVERQVEDIVRKIRPLIPISFEKVKAAIKIPAIYVGKCYGQMSGLGTIENEEYQSDGSWIGILKMSAASYGELENLLGSTAKGTAELKII